MPVGVWILGDQLDIGQSALAVSSRDDTRAIMVESLSHIAERPYHRQKIVLVWSAMRHFRELLRAEGWTCDYYGDAEEFTGVLRDWAHEHSISELRVMEPNDRPFTGVINNLDLGIPVRVIPNNQFLWTVEEFLKWARGRKHLVMEHFYRVSRRKLGVLMDGSKPEGGIWNYDRANREPPRKDLEPPQPKWFEPDDITLDVMDTVSRLDVPLSGRLLPFRWGVTHAQAAQVLDHFILHGLPLFGPQQDAMRTDAPLMWHSLISPYLNIGLLHPDFVLKRVLAAYEEKNLDLQSVEGFVRQIIGWREYLRGVYHYVDDDYSQRNFFGHNNPIPSFFWTAETEMNCIRTVVSHVLETGYAHHIQRLMILSNYALIAGLSPQETKEWFHALFIDAYDWVMQTNVLGMGLYADGGVLASKPYAASANYIKRMSDYCKSCKFNPKERAGERACPYNFLYWNFLAQHRETLEGMGRMRLVLSHLDKMPKDTQDAISERARKWVNDY